MNSWCFNKGQPRILDTRCDQGLESALGNVRNIELSTLGLEQQRAVEVSKKA